VGSRASQKAVQEVEGLLGFREAFFQRQVHSCRGLGGVVAVGISWFVCLVFDFVGRGPEVDGWSIGGSSGGFQRTE
jgi:hypothetical protein